MVHQTQKPLRLPLHRISIYFGPFPQRLSRLFIPVRPCASVPHDLLVEVVARGDRCPKRANYPPEDKGLIQACRQSLRRRHDVGADRPETGGLQVEEEARDEERGKSGHAPSIVGCVRQLEFREVGRDTCARTVL